MQILADLLIARGIKPAELDKQKRCDICRRHGPLLRDDYACTETICRELWGDLADAHWKKAEPDERDGKGVMEKIGDQLRLRGRIL